MALNSETERRHYLNAMGIQVWQSRLRGAEPAQESESAPESVEPPKESATDWDTLKQQVATCAQCELSCQRTQAVFGVGDIEADYMVIGEAPGADEDREGEPFVGRSGKLLDQMLLAIGLQREQIYIANIVKCRPPNNRDPKPEEVACCEPYLKRQIALLQPKVILAVGRVAAHNLLKLNDPLGKMRRRDFTYSESHTPVVVTYHPAYLLRSPQEKRKTWEDLLRSRSILQGE